MNTKVYSELTKGEKFIYDWQFNALGDFKKCLIEAIKKADENNLSKLYLAFPEEVTAYIKFGNEKGWWENLCTKLEVNY